MSIPPRFSVASTAPSRSPGCPRTRSIEGWPFVLRFRSISTRAMFSVMSLAVNGSVARWCVADTVEVRFAPLECRALAHGVLTSVSDPKRAIERFIIAHDERSAKPIRGEVDDVGSHRGRAGREAISKVGARNTRSLPARLRSSFEIASDRFRSTSPSERCILSRSGRGACRSRRRSRRSARSPVSSAGSRPVV